LWVSQCGPWARWPARAGKIPAMRRRIPAGEGKGGSYRSLALGFSWVGRGRGGSGGGAHRQPVALAAAAGNAGDQGLRLWLVVGGELLWARVGAEDPWGRWNLWRRGCAAASSLAAAAGGVGLRPEQGGRPYRLRAQGESQASG
jgi:hypothetical protein